MMPTRPSPWLICLALAGAGIILALLMAMFSVVQGQVAHAQQRQAEHQAHVAQRLAQQAQPMWLHARADTDLFPGR